jgi:hypothetical protein
MAVVFLSPVGGAAAQFFTNSGVILSGGKLYSFAAGTTGPQVTYTSSSGTVAHTNPIILDSAGRVPNGEIWLDALPYKFILNTSTDVLIATYDNILGIGSTNYQIQNFTGTGSQIVFTLNATVLNENFTFVYINGVYQQKNTYDVSGTTLTFSTAPPNNSSVEVMFN